MGRPRKTLAELEASGAFGVHPARRLLRLGEPQPDGEVGEAPLTLPPDIRAAWADIVATCPAGVLTDADRVGVESTARLLAMDRTGKISNPARAQLFKNLADFGMTPRGRCYVKTTKPKAKENKFSAL